VSHAIVIVSHVVLETQSTANHVTDSHKAGVNSKPYSQPFREIDMLVSVTASTFITVPIATSVLAIGVSFISNQLSELQLTDNVISAVVGVVDSKLAVIVILLVTVAGNDSHPTVQLAKSYPVSAVAVTSVVHTVNTLLTALRLVHSSTVNSDSSTVP
jgi:hypothetical protein